MSEAILDAKSVSYTYPDDGWGLPGADLRLSGGELVCIIGPNGSGKSTLLRLCAGVVCPGAGEVLLDGENLHRLRRENIARRLAYLPQEVKPDFDLTVAELVRLGRFAHARGFFGNSSPGDREACDEAMRRTDVFNKRDRRIYSLSGGERRRVLLASALAQSPAVLLLDEPTTALDIHHSVAFFKLLAELARNGMAVLTVTHDLNLASIFSDRILLMADGEIVRRGKSAEVITEPLLHKVYGSDVLVSSHPETGLPVVLPGVGQGGV